MNTVRDTKMPLYYAESNLREMTSTSPIVTYNDSMYFVGSNKLPNIAQAKEFVNQIENSPFVIAHFGVIPSCAVEFKNNLSKKSYFTVEFGRPVIRIATQSWAMNKQVILHEYAHFINWASGRSQEEASHGESFISIYRILMKEFISEDFVELFDTIFDNEKK